MNFKSVPLWLLLGKCLILALEMTLCEMNMYCKELS